MLSEEVAAPPPPSRASRRMSSYLAASHAPRNVFYPLPAELAAAPSSTAVGGASLPLHHDNTREANAFLSVTAAVVEGESLTAPQNENTPFAVPYATGSFGSALTGDLPLAICPFISNGCGTSERPEVDSAAVGKGVDTAGDNTADSVQRASATTGTPALSSTVPSQSGTGFLSALEHQQQQLTTTALAVTGLLLTPYAGSSTPSAGTPNPRPPPPQPPTSSSTPPPSQRTLDCSQDSTHQEGLLLLNSPGASPPLSPTTPTAAFAQKAAVQPALPTNHPKSRMKVGAVPLAATVEEEQPPPESDETIQREVEEDLRLSMDVAFTPSGAGNGAPPLLSQSSLMHEEEGEAQAERSQVGSTNDGRGCRGGLLEEKDGEAPASHHDSVTAAAAAPPPSTAASISGAASAIHAPALDLCDPNINTGSTVSTDSYFPLPPQQQTLSSSLCPIYDAPLPHIPVPLLGEKGERVTLAAAAAVSSGGPTSRRGRHRTVFSFSSLRAAAGKEEETSTSTPSAAEAPPPAPCVHQGSEREGEVGEEGEQTIMVPPSFVSAAVVSHRGGSSCAEVTLRAAEAIMEEAVGGSTVPQVQVPPVSEVTEARVALGETRPFLSEKPTDLSWTPQGLQTAPFGVECLVPAPLPSAPSVLLDTPTNSCGVSTSPTSSLQGPPLSLAPPSSPLHTFVPVMATAAARPARTCFTLRSPMNVTETLTTMTTTAAAGAIPTPTVTSGTAGAVVEGCSSNSNSNSFRRPPLSTFKPLVTTADSLGEGMGLTSSPGTDQHDVAHPALDSAAFDPSFTAAPTVLETTSLPEGLSAVVDVHGGPTSVNSHDSTVAPPVVSPLETTVAAALPVDVLHGSEVGDNEEEHHDVHMDEEQELLTLPSNHVVGAVPPTPTVSSTAHGNDFYDLPRSVGDFYAKQRGVTRLYDWQHELLTQPEVRRGGNFIYSLPTSGGKTLVAELSLLRCVLNRRRSGFFVLPFVSLAEEKTLALQPLTNVFDFSVDGHYGSSGRFPLCDAPAIYVCTIEKANSLLNYMLEEGRTAEIGVVVVDELHMVGESRRGATLELFLSKLLMIDKARQKQREHAAAMQVHCYEQSRDDLNGRVNATEDKEAAYYPENQEGELEGHGGHPAQTEVFNDPGPLQIVGMSATVPNLSTIAQWLRAACFERDFRPVPLRAYSVVGGLVLRDGQRSERSLSGSSVNQHLLELATEVPEASVLIFCASRQQCVDTARGIVNYIKAQAIAGQQLPPASLPGLPAASGEEAPSFSVFGVAFPEVVLKSTVASVPSQASLAIKTLLADLTALAHYEASQLSEVVPHGVAFHHGGLLAEERELIEAAFRRKHLRILCSTSTLAAGVNLPARRVIIKTPYVGRDFLTKSRYLQMCGRAGRAGLDPYGESFLLLSRRDQSRGHALMHAAVEPCRSQILEDEGTLTRSLLECVGVGLVTDWASAQRWAASLLGSHAVGPVDTVWRGHLLATATNTTNASVKDCGVDHSTTVAFPEESESSRSVPAPPPPPPSAPPLLSVPVTALESMVRASLHTLARCGLVAVSYASPNDAEGHGAEKEAVEDAEEEDACEGGEGVEARSAASRDGGLQVHVTPFGSSSVRSCFSVEEALLLRKELDELRRTGLILSDDLHLCYFLTPLREVGECDWELLRLMMSRMSDSRQRIASLLGVDAYFIDQRAMGLGGPLEASEEGRRRLFTAKRFYVALMLADVLAEVPMATVEQRYNVNRGQLQNLMRSASMFSSSITSFCHAMEWYSLEAVLSSFVKRLGFGVKPDLLPLMEIRGMQPPRARALWNAGFKKLSLIAAADADDMVARVKSMNPPESKSAKFFTKRSALMVIREANLTLQSQIKEKKGELQELTTRGSTAR
jgi:replicative superfamily II helicase